MKSKTTFNCLHCREKHVCDPRNRGRQCYCGKPECRQASKAASQRRWAGKPENENYFRGPENIERVRQWRKEHPGYWRRKKPGKQDALQDLCQGQDAGNKAVVDSSKGSVLWIIGLRRFRRESGYAKSAADSSLRERFIM
jgi:hypothetical protein